MKRLAALVKEGEGPALEFKRSTGELKEGMQTLWAFLNGSGGRVLFGVRPGGIHRDYSIAGGAISLAIFDDRVEIWSAGTFPTGITPEKLSKSHQSVQRNPIIADVFYKTGLIEKWGRGTNRVIEMSLEAGIAPPKFEEITGAAVVTFKINVRGPQQIADQVVGRLGTDAVPSLSQVRPE